MKTILVPIDFSDATEKTATTAFSLVQDIQVKLVFLHVVDPSLPVRIFTPLHGKIASTETDETQAAQQLQRLVRRARTQGIIAEYRLATGSTVAQILEQAKLLKAELIVMGSHDYASEEGSTVGNTSKGVLYASPCPIVLVPSDKAQGLKLHAPKPALRAVS